MATSVTDAQAQYSTHRAPVPLTAVDEVESSLSTPQIGASLVSDIENVHVNDDPRQWSPKLKVSPFLLRFMAFSRLSCRVLIIHPIGR
jgi:hypothetical protein